MNKSIKLSQFKFTYDEQKTPAIINQTADTIVFLYEDYADVLLRVEFKDDQLSFLPTDNLNLQSLKISRINNLEYAIQAVE